MHQLGDLTDSFTASPSCFAASVEKSREAVNELVATMHRSIEREICSTCKVPFAVSTTRVDSMHRINYLKRCAKCGAKAKQPELVPIDCAPPRTGPGRPKKIPSSVN